jgi:hypothetical protein
MYARILEESYACTKTFEGEISRLSYLSRHIFNFTTYDDTMFSLPRRLWKYVAALQVVLPFAT